MRARARRYVRGEATHTGITVKPRRDVRRADTDLEWRRRRVSDVLAHAASDEQPLGQAADEGVAGIQLLLRDPFIRLVCLGDMAGAANDGRDVGRLVVAAFRA